MIQVYEGDGLDTRRVTFRLAEPTINTVNDHDDYEFRWSLRKRGHPVFNYKAHCCTLVFGHTTDALRIFKGMRQCAIDGIAFDIEFDGDVPCFDKGVRSLIRHIHGYGIVHYGTFDGGGTFMTVGMIEQCRVLHEIAGKQPLPTRGLSPWVWDEL